MSPTRQREQRPSRAKPAGTALCLSGGGYRAMVFHVGVIRRLAEARVLGRLTMVSSVSGGSITAGALALVLAWPRLGVDPASGAVDLAAYDRLVRDPILAMAGRRVDLPAVLRAALPGTSVSRHVAGALRRHLYGDATLADLPDSPAFVFNASNLQTGVRVHLGKDKISDYRVGEVRDPRLPIAWAVTASAAFPPFLSPCVIDLSRARWHDSPSNPRDDFYGNAFRRLRLTDGGVYDNLGVDEPTRKAATLLVSDGGGRLKPDPASRLDWGRGTLRVLHVVDNQVRSLRKRALMDGFGVDPEKGMYVGTFSNPAEYKVFPDKTPLVDPMPADPEVTRALADLPTRLWPLDPCDRRRLVNWGYTICDTGLRTHMGRGEPRGRLPFPDCPI